MFFMAEMFNQPIGDWNVSKVNSWHNIINMFVFSGNAYKQKKPTFKKKFEKV